MPHSYRDDTALIVVDMQNDFADPSGSLYVTGGEETIAPINAEIEAARKAGALVVFTQDWHPPETPHFQDFGGIWPVHCVTDTWGARLVDGLDADGPIVHKGTGGEDGYSGFTVRDDAGQEHPTGLSDLLRENNVKHAVVVGLALDYCVKDTALDGAALGFQVTLLSEATRAVNLEPDDGTEAISAMESAGVHIE